MSRSDLAPSGASVPDPSPDRPTPVASAVEVVAATVLLAVASAGGAVVCGVWLTQRIAGVAAPVTIVVAAGWGWVLLTLARQWSNRALVVATPSIVWILTLVVMNTGPGRDMPIPVSLRGLGLLFAGGVLPLWWVLLRTILGAGAGTDRRDDTRRG